MAHVLVYHDALNQFRLLQAPARLALHLDQVKIDVRVVAHRLLDTEHGVHGNLGHLDFVDVDDLRRQGRGGRFHENFVVDVFFKMDRVRDVLERGHGDLARGFKAFGDPYRVQAAVQELLRLL